MKKKTLLLDICCAPCATHPIEILAGDYDIALYFYNPNIHPKEEYWRRLDAARYYADLKKLPLIVEGYDTQEWFRVTQGLASEKEGGQRCAICFTKRLEAAASYAFEHRYDIFTTTLTVSPYKKASLINEIGNKIGNSYGVDFMAADFKKKDGYKKSIELSRKAGLYRQKYCGCLYSMPEARD
ncbi:MAG: epoxyqueuosine reductase QueH [Chlamydiota bacterium]